MLSRRIARLAPAPTTHTVRCVARPVRASFHSVAAVSPAHVLTASLSAAVANGMRAVTRFVPALTTTTTATAAAPSAAASVLPRIASSLESVHEWLAAEWSILMAAPKRRTSKMKQRLRRWGQWATSTGFGRRQYRPYGTCTGCGNPVRTHHLCLVCRKMHPKI